MARTGESYTTARRRFVTAAAREQARELPPGLVPGYDTFGGGQHRLSALAAHLLRQTGQTYSEAMLAGLAGGIGFMYAVFEYAGWPPLMTIVAQHHPEPWLPAILKRLDVGYVEQHNTAPKPALAALHAALDEGRPVYCTVDMTALPWHAGEVAHSEVPYEVVVAGRHDGVLYLDDSAVTPAALPEPDFRGRLDPAQEGPPPPDRARRGRAGGAGRGRPGRDRHHRGAPDRPGAGPQLRQQLRPQRDGQTRRPVA